VIETIQRCSTAETPKSGPELGRRGRSAQPRGVPRPNSARISTPSSTRPPAGGNASGRWLGPAASCDALLQSRTRGRTCVPRSPPACVAALGHGGVSPGTGSRKRPPRSSCPPCPSTSGTRLLALRDVGSVPAVLQRPKHRGLVVPLVRHHLRGLTRGLFLRPATSSVGSCAPFASSASRARFRLPAASSRLFSIVAVSASSAGYTGAATMTRSPDPRHAPACRPVACARP